MTKTIKETERQVWRSSIITLLGAWLWKQEEYGHAMLCFHAPSLGMKVGEQLNIKWKHFIDDFEQIKYKLIYNDGKVKDRQLSIFIQNLTLDCYKALKIKDRNNYVYTNAKTGKVLTTSTLNRELARFSEAFLLDLYEKTDRYLPMRELKSNAFETAWGVDMVNKYMRTKKVFMAVSKHMGHRTMEDTYQLLGLRPNDTIELRFNLVRYSDLQLEQMTFFDDKRKLKRLIDETALNFLRKEIIEEQGIKIE